MRLVGLAILAAAMLAACGSAEDREVAFCRDFALSRLAGKAAGAQIRDVRIADSRLDSEAAIRTLFPRYVGFDGFGIRRSDHAWRMIYLLRALPATRRDIALELEVVEDGRLRRTREDCTFLRLDDVPQFVSERHLQRLVTARAIAAADGGTVDCCVPVDREVR